MSPIKDKFLASYSKQLLILVAENWKKSAFKLSIEDPILLIFVNSSQIFSEGLLVIVINKARSFSYKESHLMVIWFMMKPIMHLCIKDLESVEINISEPNITLLNLISHFKNHLLGIGKSSHHSFNIRMLIISCHEPYSSLSFWLFGECPFWKNDN